jgi:glutathione S-transferase
VSDQAAVLWQYSFSNYNEKVRWALDHKSIPHRRRSLFPGGPRSLMFSRNGTLPVLDLDGERIVDSTRIIEALEQRHPDPPLYPSDPDERSRALELEDFFDEHAGHDLRRIAFWDARDAPGWIADFMATDQPPAKRAVLRAMLPGVRLVMRRRFAITDQEVERSRTVLRAALDRIESERSGGGPPGGRRLHRGRPDGRGAALPDGLATRVPVRAPGSTPVAIPRFGQGQPGARLDRRDLPTAPGRIG